MSWNKQIENRNFLSPSGFKFTLAKFPKIAYFCQSANIPGISVGTPMQPTPFRSIPLDGSFTYDSLNITFLVDENLDNYIILHNWLKGIGVPNEFRDRNAYREKMKEEFGNDSLTADGSLAILNSNFSAKFDVSFKDLIPTSLQTLEFSANEDSTNYFVAQATFQYSYYEIKTIAGAKITKLT